MAVRSPIPAPPRSKLTQNRRPRPRRHLLRRDGAIRTPPLRARFRALTRPAGQILTGSTDRLIRLYNPATASAPAQQPSAAAGKAGPAPPGLVQTYAGHAHPVLALAVAADNARFASGGGDRAVLAWDVASASVVRRLEGHGARVNDVAWGGDGVIVSGELSPPRRRMERREGWREGWG